MADKHQMMSICCQYLYFFDFHEKMWLNGIRSDMSWGSQLTQDEENKLRNLFRKLKKAKRLRV